ncbi:hypothetical protein MFIFM68171_08958 [Madurella fahalii]|uniref:Uncharacterized protein n=1 Tax=Madurella fahalii TaxID=1157608 RepID=A0ABQ0GLV7_9PEZI
MAPPRANNPKPTDDSTQHHSLDKSPRQPENRLTAFFCKLRPSRRPERGGTARQATDNAGEPAAHCSILARQQQHRRQRQALKRSGDFLGVTGVNPYTGILDIVTPPTSSEEGEEDGAGSCVSSSVIPRSSLLAGLSRDAQDARDKYEMALAKRNARVEKEERRLARAEQRKEVVREVTDLGSLSEDSVTPRTRRGRVQELDDDNSAEEWTGDLDQGLDSSDGSSQGEATDPSPWPIEHISGSTRPFPSACTRIITTTTSWPAGKVGEATRQAEDYKKPAWQPREHGQEWEMRKTMRRPEHPSHDGGPKPAATQSPPTYTACLAKLPCRHLAQTVARGAARAAFQVASRAAPEATTRGAAPAPVPASATTYLGNPHGAGQAKATATAKPGAAPPPVQGSGGDDPPVTTVIPDDKGGIGGRSRPADIGRVLGSCVRTGASVAVKLAWAYWHVVSPVFDGGSEARQRFDEGQATYQDCGICVLAVMFVFLAVSAGVWVIRGIVWAVRGVWVVVGVVRLVAGFG